MFRKLEFDWPTNVVKMFEDLSAFNLNIFSVSPPEVGRCRLTLSNPR